MVWRTNITTLSAKSREPAWVLRFCPWRSQTVSDKQQVRQSLNWCSALAKVRPLASILNNIIMLWLLWTNWIFCVWKIKLVCSQSQYLYSPIKDINIDKDKNKVSIKKIKKKQWKMVTQECVYHTINGQYQQLCHCRSWTVAVRKQYNLCHHYFCFWGTDVSLLTVGNQESNLCLNRAYLFIQYVAWLSFSTVLESFITRW